MARPPGDRRFFLRKSVEIEHVKKVGRRVQCPLFNLVYCPSSSPYTRIGIVVGKRFGRAVARNRVKRVFRELARQLKRELVAGRDLVVFPRREALRVGHSILRQAWLSALRQEGLVMPDSDSRCDHSASV